VAALGGSSFGSLGGKKELLVRYGMVKGLETKGKWVVLFWVVGGTKYQALYGDMDNPYGVWKYTPTCKAQGGRGFVFYEEVKYHFLATGVSESSM
jgi:hypothetical protein